MPMLSIGIYIIISNYTQKEFFVLAKAISSCSPFVGNKKG